jgi:hypothetical protein
MRSGPILQHGTLTWDPDPDSMTELPGHAFNWVDFCLGWLAPYLGP